MCRNFLERTEDGDFPETEALISFQKNLEFDLLSTKSAKTLIFKIKIFKMQRSRFNYFLKGLAIFVLYE